MIEALSESLQHLCSQSRCFWIDQSPLPVCQRCLGLYAGIAITVVWLAASGVWRRGLAPSGVLALHVAVLLAAMAGGLHWIDPGPRWRLACGLWTGHVAALWIVGGMTQVTAGKSTGGISSLWPRWATLQAVLAVPLMSVLAAVWPWLERLGWFFWTAVAFAGIAAIGLTVLTAMSVIAIRAAKATLGRMTA